ncbi:MAG: AAA family ATPase [Leptolyngbyaceae bacterium]|nr:AAA family ATPase [Leptolyngbyaceae bacterium]
MTDSSLPALIQQMQMPEFYPHPVETPIRVVQTHISYVLLTGDFAYKVKKPLDFGFLNYSTLDRRQHFCAEELRLNQRGAAELYLEVLPITQSGDAFHLNDEGEGEGEGEGDAVEYTVKMRQFPQETLLDRLFEQGKLTEELVNDLAIAIADFHTAAHTDDYIQSFGTVDSIRKAFDENYAQTEHYIGGPQTQQQFDETRAYTDTFFAERADLFQQRIHDGWIRECHGDLHLGNICYWNETLYLFDCIEFNEDFRFVDVMFDIAYIVMDLEMQQRTDLSAAFLNTYVERTGDWEGLDVLPIYVNRQSYVRAKVTSFMLDDPSVDEETKAKASEKAAKYYTLAWNYTQPKTGKLILMTGLSGSGKSTTARLLAGKLNAVQIRSDAVRKHLAGVPVDQRGDDSIYTPEMSQKTYDRLLELGIRLAKAGYAVILDAKYDRVQPRMEAIAQAADHHIPIHILHCDAPMEVRLERVQQRTGDIADVTANLIPKQVFESFTGDEAPHVCVLDTTKDTSAQLAKWLETVS